MAYSKVVASLLVALISSLISCVQINAAVINLHNQYIRDRQDVLRLLSMNSGHHKVKKRANHHRRRFWTRPGRTSAWWDNFIYELRLFTPRSSYGAKEMAPKSQLCACSFQDSLRQKNWALKQIRKFPDTIGYVWTAENDSNTLRVDAKIFSFAKKYLRKNKFPDTCGHGLKFPPPSHPC